MNAIPGRAANTRSGNRPRLRRTLEVLGWVGLVSFFWGVDLLTKLAEAERLGLDARSDRLVVEQVTSAVAVLLLIPFVARWLTMFPLRRDVWAAAVVGHTAGTVLFAFSHHALIVLQRSIWFALQGETYIWRDPFVANLIVEYQKDIKIYLGIVAVIAGYRYFRQQRRTPAVDNEERLVVQTGSADRLLRFDEIDFLEAAGNYVSVFSAGREFVVRETMAGILERLPPGRFIRIHRRYIVNLDKVIEIRNRDGKQWVSLDPGREIPVSRGFRSALRDALDS